MCPHSKCAMEGEKKNVQWNLVDEYQRNRVQSPTGDIIDQLSLGSKTEEGRFNSNFLLALLLIVNEFYFILCTPIFISGRKPGAVSEKILASPTALPFHRALNQA